MTALYVPSKLQQAGMEIEQMHKKVAKVHTEEDEELKYLIDKIVKLKADKVLPFAKVLDEVQISQIAEYFCYDYWHKPLTNLMILLVYKGSRDDWAVIFKNWQNLYDSDKNISGVKDFLQKALNADCKFSDYITWRRITRDNIAWLSARDMIGALCEGCGNCMSESSYEYSLLAHGLVKDTRLFNKCYAKYLLFCSRNGILSYGISRLVNAFQEMEMEDKKQFCRNLLNRLQLSDLFPQKALFDRITYWNSKGLQLSSVLSKVELVKYQQWKMYYEIQQTLEGDPPRRDFWLQYIGSANDVVKYPTYNPVIMYIVFGDYVVVEFVKKAAGPTYLYLKPFFDKEVKRHMYMLSKTEFQKWEHDISESRTSGCLRRMPHPQGWQSDHTTILRRYGISPTRYY